MAENINLEVDKVLTVFSNLRDRNPEAAKRTEEVLRLILGREGFLPGDLAEALKPLTDQIGNLIANQTTIQTRIGELMARTDQLGQQIDANTAQANKAFAEIRKALDDALKTQITPEEMAAAVADAKTAQKSEDEAAFDAALQPIMDKVNTQSAALQKLDDIVPDAPTPAPEPTPGPTPAPEPTPTPGPTEPPVTPTV